MDAERRRETKTTKNGDIIKAKCLVEIWTDEEIQCQLSATGGKQKIWETIATIRVQ